MDWVMIWRGRFCAAICLVLMACGGGGDDAAGNSAQCTAKQSKDAVRSYMRSDYFWNSQVQSQLNNDLLYVQAGADVERYFNSLLWTPALGGKDKYSFIYTSAQYSQASNGESVGHGIDWAWAGSGSARVLRVRYVEPGSEGAIKGVLRGDTLLTVNGAALVYGSVTQAQLTALLPSSANVTTTLTLQSALGGKRTVILTSKKVEESPVLLSQTMTAADGQKVGYLVFNTFMAEKGLTQLQTAFRKFKTDGISDLVLDLRYNGGGSLSIAQALAGMIAGEAVRGKTFYRLIHNSNLRSRDQSLSFSIDADSTANLGLKRVFILTGSGSASASEALIYGLKPFVDVIQIGETTHGKPVGMYVTPMCGDVYLAINFEGVNANNEGGYYSGIAPTCSVADNLNHVLGNSGESMLSAALAYRTAGKCPSLAAAGVTQSQAQAMQSLQANPLRNNLLITR